ncbi:CaiB/BaiF CoA transferase family protein [Sphingosinithalassobacter sp. CS137]|uniref:CaiB/BaiF CoA transferase family protein n=1 Tax=Sphingosinithalassobacter sp. CS137 TaxID=2762748 RepID=UPI00165EB7DA|nr:CaiB/BaiF CoA-transferase family protein [Sphingosinithalassobacter sp. CS137]
MMHPLNGVRIVEMAGIGPGPFCGMMLADHGAEVMYCHRPGAAPDPRDPLLRGRRPVEIDLKSPEGVARIRELTAQADGLFEGFRPGVMERLGLGPDVLCADNPRLVFGRMTGWGQTGPLANAAGHDINYIALSGALHAFGRAGGKPTPPVNAVGDFGGGGMMMAFAMVSGILGARASGLGTVIDCAMTEGSALLMNMVWGFRETLGWVDDRGVNLLDTGAHFYDTFETADGKHIALGAIEPQFYALFREVVGIADDPAFDAQMDRTAWPDLKQRLDTLFLTRTRDEWCSLLEGTDACFAPVLSMSEAPDHPHNAARGSFIERAGVVQPGPAPRFDPPPATE